MARYKDGKFFRRNRSTLVLDGQPGKAKSRVQLYHGRTVTGREKEAIGNNILAARDVVNQAIQALSRDSRSLGPNTHSAIERAFGIPPARLIEDLKGIANGLYSRKFEIELVDNAYEGRRGTSKFELAPYRDMPGRARRGQYRDSKPRIAVDMVKSHVCDEHSGAEKVIRVVAPAAIGVTKQHAAYLASFAVVLKEAMERDAALDRHRGKLAIGDTLPRAEPQSVTSEAAAPVRHGPEPPRQSARNGVASLAPEPDRKPPSREQLHEDNQAALAVEVPAQQMLDLVASWDRLIERYHTQLAHDDHSPAYKEAHAHLEEFGKALAAQPAQLAALCTFETDLGVEQRPELQRIANSQDPARETLALIRDAERQQRRQTRDGKDPQRGQDARVQGSKARVERRPGEEVARMEDQALIRTQLKELEKSNSAHISDADYSALKKALLNGLSNSERTEVQRGIESPRQSARNGVASLAPEPDRKPPSREQLHEDNQAALAVEVPAQQMLDLVASWDRLIERYRTQLAHDDHSPAYKEAHAHLEEFGKALAAQPAQLAALCTFETDLGVEQRPELQRIANSQDPARETLALIRDTERQQRRQSGERDETTKHQGPRAQLLQRSRARNALSI